MASFTRRYQAFPGTEVIRQIEGVVILDLPAPGTLQPRGAGVACCVGEFADMTYATQVDGTGTVTTNIQPQAVFSSADLADKFGGFDETLGDFGTSGGNGFVDVQGKTYGQLVIAPVNLCSAKGMRFFRDLPLNISATVALPVVPMVSTRVAAGREFRSGSGRLRLGRAITFTGASAIASGIAGATVANASAATQVFNATAGWDWTTLSRPDGTVGAQKGDILVIGYNTAGAKTPTAEAGTYRIAATPVSGVAVTVERLDGVNFTWTAQTTISWRLHQGSDADTAPMNVVGSSLNGGYAAADVGGYSVPVRPLTNITGGVVDGTWTASTLVTPVPASAVTTGSTWDPLSGFAGRVIPTGGLDYTAAIQQSNAPAVAGLDAKYVEAMDATISDNTPMSDINIIWCSRTSATIRSYVKTNVLSASGRQAGRMGIIQPELTVQSLTTAISDTSPGVGAVRDERIIYTWPGEQTFVKDAVNFRLKVANGTVTTGGTLDVGFAAHYASVLSVLPPERNPGQSATPVPQLLSTVAGQQRGTPKLGLDEYSAMKARGISGLRIDKDTGPQIQSGNTTSLIAGQTEVKRRRFADYCQDNQASILQPFSKLPQSNTNKDAAICELGAFFEDLKSDNNPAAQRMDDYSLDDKSGNTPALSAANIWVIISKVKMTPTADYIVVQSEVGEGVVVTKAQ